MGMSAGQVAKALGDGGDPYPFDLAPGKEGCLQGGGMRTPRKIRLDELLRRELAGALFHVLAHTSYDLSALTITRVLTSSDLRHARVRISIRGYEGQREEILRLLRHHRVAFQSWIAERVIMKYTPRLTFELDPSLEAGDRMLELLDSLEIPASPETGDEPDAAGPGVSKDCGE